MKKHNKYSLLGLQALQRAADKVAEEAIKNNYKIPIWKDGKIVFVIPKKESYPRINTDEHEL